ncbi:hypothetical protein GF369_03730 [Candidatus Peregrinibacteria bacterium]|nr:hypothetical protein [Candidatus Peregrinibacteria bacterium]
MTLPNYISFFRIFLVPFAIGALFFEFPYHYHVAIVIYAIAAASDLVDGYLARTLKQESKMGILLDPIADKLLHVLVMIALATLEVFPLWIVMVLIARELIVDTSLKYATIEKLFIKPPFYAKFKSFFIDIAILCGELFLIMGITVFQTIAFVNLLVALILGVMGGRSFWKHIFSKA